jgi:hypothetical protein
MPAPISTTTAAIINQLGMDDGLMTDAKITSTAAEKTRIMRAPGCWRTFA